MPFTSHCGLVGNHSPRNTEDVGSIQGTGKYRVVLMTTQNGGPLSLVPFPSARLKNLKEADKWSSLSLCLSVRRMSVI